MTAQPVTHVVGAEAGTCWPASLASWQLLLRAKAESVGRHWTPCSGPTCSHVHVHTQTRERPRVKEHNSELEEGTLELSPLSYVAFHMPSS